MRFPKFTALVVVGLMLSATGYAQDHKAHSMGAMGGASQAYMDAMAKMDADMKAMDMTGKPGADFVLMMIPHHQAAIDMAKAYLASGDKDPELTKLSEDIVAAQEKEIGFMRDWLKRNGH